MINLYIIEDHQLLRETLKQRFQSIKDIYVIGEAGHIKEAQHDLFDAKDPSKNPDQNEPETHLPDVILLDVSMPDGDGISFAQTLRKHNINSAIVFLSMHREAVLVNRALQVKDTAYVAKNDSFRELEAAIRAVHKHKQYVSSTVKTDRVNTSNPLSTREQEVLSLLAEGLNQPTIAKDLDISLRTVETGCD